MLPKANNVDLCTSFKELALWTWSQIKLSTELKSPFNEETITESIVLKLKEKHPASVGIYAFSKREEHKVGADWEIWFLDNSNKRGIGWLLQAKRVYLPSLRYQALKPNLMNGNSQTSRLIRHSKTRGLSPMYLLYNWVPEDFDLSKVPRGSILVANRSLFGCALASAEALRRKNTNRLTELSEISVPWHHAVCPSSSDRKNDLLSTVIDFTHPQMPESPQTFVQPVAVPAYVATIASQRDLASQKESMSKAFSDKMPSGVRGVLTITEEQTD